MRIKPMQTTFPTFTMTDFKSSGPGDENCVAQGEGPNNMASVINTLFKSVTVIKSNGDGNRYNQNCFMIHTVQLSSS